MPVGDKVEVLGTVKDIVDQSTLIETDDGHEYWILSKHVSPVPPPAAAATETVPPAPHETTSTHGHTPAGKK